jgi:hypothetical protein
MRKIIASILLCTPVIAQQANPSQTNKAARAQKSLVAQAATQTENTSQRTNLWPTTMPFKCVEAYLSADTVHGGTDYGAAITAAVRASSLTTPTELRLCAPGDHPVYTTGIFDRPVSFWAYGSRLIPQSSMSSATVSIAATATGASHIVTVKSPSGLSLGMAVGGVGIPPGAYITSINGTKVTLSLPATLQFYGVASSGSATILGVNSMSGLAIGQVLYGHGNWPFFSGTTTINAIDYGANTITTSSTATTGSAVPNSFMIRGSWKADLTFVAATPVLNWTYNARALHNQYFQMIGASMHGVWIADPGTRSLPGVQGIQIEGYDGFNSYDLRVDNLAGSGEILGGNTGRFLPNLYGPVRESTFINDQIRNTGDAHTGQAALAVMTPYEGGNSVGDEMNQISFVGGHYVCSNGVAVTIGTYNTSHTGTNGPRLIFFSDNTQIEGCAVTFDTSAQSDTVYVQRAGSLYFNGTELALVGQGKAVIRLDDVSTLHVINSFIDASSISVDYTVNVTNGSTTVKYVRGGGGAATGFNTTQTWDGIGILIGSKSMHLAPLSPVASNGLTVRLSSPWAGSTASYTMTVGYGGAFVEASGNVDKVSLVANNYTGNDTQTNAFLAVPSVHSLFEVGSAFIPGIDSSVTVDDFDGIRLTTGPTEFKTGGVVDTSRQGTQFSWDQTGTGGETDIITVKGNGAGGTCFYSIATGAVIGIPTNCFTGTGGLTLQDKMKSTLIRDTDGFQLTPFSDKTLKRDIYGTNAANTRMNWYIGRTGGSFPSVNSVDGYKFNGKIGFTGTKRSGSCVFTIQGGIITNVTEC